MWAKREYLPELAAELHKLDAFEVLTDGSDMPVVTWTTDARERHWNLHDLSAKLRERGWQVPPTRCRPTSRT